MPSIFEYLAEPQNDFLIRPLPTSSTRALRGYLRRQLRPSWDMLKADAATNRPEMPALPMRRLILEAVAEAFHGHPLIFGYDNKCLQIAYVTAAVATVVTGDIYRCHSGKFYVLKEHPDGGVMPAGSMLGRGDDFHFWVMAGRPGERCEFVDAQQYLWEEDPGFVCWDWADKVITECNIRFESRRGMTERWLKRTESYSWILDEIVEMAMEAVKRRQASAVSEEQDPDSEEPELPTSTAPAVGRCGRNEPCPCGSGKKFKKCHGRHESLVVPA